MPMLRLLVRKVFAGDDRFEVVGEAQDGIEALRVVHDMHPDVLLLDLAMPNMDGLEVLSRFQETGTGPVTIVLSGFAEEGANAALHLGAAAYINKAEDVMRLPDLVADVLRRRLGDRVGPWPVVAPGATA